MREFVIAFRDAEHAAYRAMLLEPDYQYFRRARQDLEAFAPEIRLSSQVVRYEDEPLPTKTEAYRQLASIYSPRELLRLEKYKLPAGETVYAACMTDTFAMPDSGLPALKMSIRYLVQASSDGLEIVSLQHPPDAGFPYWETTGGKDIQLPENPDEIDIYIEEES